MSKLRRTAEVSGPLAPRHLGESFLPRKTLQIFATQAGVLAGVQCRCMCRHL